MQDTALYQYLLGLKLPWSVGRDEKHQKYERLGVLNYLIISNRYPTLARRRSIKDASVMPVNLSFCPRLRGGRLRRESGFAV